MDREEYDKLVSFLQDDICPETRAKILQRLVTINDSLRNYNYEESWQYENGNSNYYNSELQAKLDKIENLHQECLKAGLLKY